MTAGQQITTQKHSRMHSPKAAWPRTHSISNWINDFSRGHECLGISAVSEWGSSKRSPWSRCLSFWERGTVVGCAHTINWSSPIPALGVPIAGTSRGVHWLRVSGRPHHHWLQMRALFTGLMIGLEHSPQHRIHDSLHYVFRVLWLPPETHGSASPGLRQAIWPN